MSSAEFDLIDYVLLRSLLLQEQDVVAEFVDSLPVADSDGCCQGFSPLYSTTGACGCRPGGHVHGTSTGSGLDQDQT